MTASEQDQQIDEIEGIAVIGMAGRFPGAADLATFWQQLRNGVEGIRSFSDEELLAAGVDPALLADPRYVKAGGSLDAIEYFDAGFFGFTPREAEVMDPQHRLFLETAWAALEDAGYVPDTFPGVIGLFGGMSIGTYLLYNLLANRDLAYAIGPLQLRLFNDKDFLTSVVAYKLNLNGPCITIQTGCSTSLVAIAMACQSLQQYQCDIALAGGVSVSVPAKSGYLTQEGVTSPDGHCRAFDQDAQGTVYGNGVGIVVLKRLADAIADGDQIYALIKGAAINNDGAVKMGYTAPSAEGQQEVIAMAQAIAAVPAESISYVETHGTATPLGDPIEIAALSRAFRKQTDQTGFCAIGSVKTNIGHLDAAAGVAGFIKTVLALKHKELPPSLHFTRPNPQIDFASSPFYVNAQLQAWPADSTPRRAGVSAFSMGGVNAHVILEEAPDLPPATTASRPWQLLLLSARSATALETMSDRLAAHLREHPELPLADVAYTLQVGRKSFAHRRIVLCQEAPAALEALETRDPTRMQNAVAAQKRVVAFMFSGVGDQYVQMGAELYQHEPIFREHVDRCAELLLPQLGLDLRDVLYPARNPATPSSAASLDLRAMLRGRGTADEQAQRLNRISVLHPALFVVEYALAQLWMAWGVQPQALIGYSIGEYVAACLAGVFSLEDALRCVATRARLIEQLSGGAMLVVGLSEAEIRPWLSADLSLAAVNGPNSCVLAGPTPAIAALEQQLVAQGIDLRRVQADYAFHSPLMQPSVAPLAQLLKTIRLSAPQIPLISNVSGTWLTPEQATDPNYWAQQLVHPVRFGDGVGTLWQAPGRLLLEIGPGQGLCGWAMQHPACPDDAVLLPSLRPFYMHQSDQLFLLTTLGKLWLAGVPIDWAAFTSAEVRQRVSLPSYPFERQRYWIDPPAVAVSPSHSAAAVALLSVPDTPALPLPAARSANARPNLTTPYVAAQHPDEQRLVALWQELLGIQPIGIHDNFFELGGHSLLATQIITRLRDLFQLELTLSDLFDIPTVAGLAARITRLRQSAGPVARIPLLPRDGELPLSPPQQRLWFIYQFDPHNVAYNIPFAVQLAGALDLPRLEQSFNQILARHEALRTTFATVEGRAVQLIHPPQFSALPVIDLTQLPGESRDAELERLLSAEARQPFDLEHDWPIRLRVFQLGADAHVLALTMHHIVADAWSIGVFMRELVALYSADQAVLPELRIQYADYAAWQRERWQGPTLEQQLDYWRQRLVGAPPLLELPSDRPRPAVQRFQGSTVPLALGPQLSAQIHQLCQAADVTPFMLLLAAFNVLLLRYSGQEDITIGTPVANRTQLETEDLIGFFVNTLVIRNDLAGAPSFRELLKRVRSAALSAFDHAETPFELVVDALQPERSLSHTPLFQVMFVLQTVANLSAFDISLPGDLRMQARSMHHGTAKFDLLLDLAETEQGFSGFFEYNSDLFDASTIARMIGHFQTLLAHSLAHPDQPITTLPLLSAAEYAQLFESATPLPEFASAPCPHQFFEVQAVLRASATALVCDTQRLSYGDLNRRANQLAHYLRQQGVQPGDLVALYLERSVELIVAILAVHKAGAAYLPLDLAYPPERLAFMLADAAPRLLLWDDYQEPGRPGASLGEWWPDIAPSLPSLHLISLSEAGPAIARQPSHNPDSGVTPANLGYVIYTSGSTGKPKGVMVSHAQVVRLFTATAPWFEFNERDVWTLFHSTAFDFSVWEIWGALIYGGRLVIVPYLTSRSPDAFYRLLQAEKVTVLNQTPSAFRQLIQSDAAQDMAADLTLRYVIFGGEALEFASLRPWFARHGDQHPQLVNMYGITETTVHVTYRPVRLADLEGAPVSAIGQPIPDLRLYLLDRNGQPLPIGVPGELYVAGAGLAQGYLQRPDLTAARFVPDPFSGVPGARLYRSGDLARWLPNGDLEYLGRSDQQVQLRGFRVELGEISAQLLQHPAVREAAVLLHTGQAGDQRIIAYVVPHAEQDASPPEQLPAALRSFLSARLPDYMLPAAIIPLAALPLTTNGKLDRAALPAPDSSRPVLEQPFEPPRSPAEVTLAAIWAQVLELDQVGIHDNFFALGGDSIRSVQVLTLAREQGIHFTLPQLFQHPTIAALCANIDPRSAVPVLLDLSPFGLISATERARLPGNIEDAYPLSALQRGMLFHSLAGAAQGVYHDVFSFHLRLPLDLAQLRAAIAELAAAHPVLRSAFNLTSTREPLQLVYPELTIPLGVADLSALSPAAADSAVSAWITSEQQHSFDWTQPPLLRFQVHQRHADTFQLSLSFHHAILDGWSVASLLTELLQRYVRRVINPTLPLLPAPSTQFRDFVALERQAEQDAEQARFWQTRLAGCVPFALPPRPTPPQPDELAERSYVVALPPDLAAGLLHLAQQEALPLKSVLLAAHLRVLALLGGTADIVTGLVTHGRPDVLGSERIAGLFLNTLPMRLELRGGSWRDLLQATSAAEQAQWPARRYPLAAIQRAHPVLAQMSTAFNFTHFHVYQQISAIPGVEVLAAEVFERTNFSLVAQFSLASGEQMVQLRLDYDPTALSAAQVAHIGDYYTRVLTAMHTDLEQDYLHFSPLTVPEPPETAAQTATSDLLPPTTLHEWFAQQVARTPDAIALSWNGQQICYAALDHRANQLAHALRRHGVGPEQRVGLLLERGPTLLIALLAVLKAGAAYVPLDPAYPAARRDFILRDAQVRLLLSDDIIPPAAEEAAPPYQQIALRDWTPFAQEATYPPCSGATAANLAYLIYTSGSTGTPKGVMVSHAQVVRLFTATAPWFEFNERDVWTLFHSAAFDFSVWEIWGAWLFGGRLVVVPYLLSRNPEQFSQLLRAEAVTVLNQTPTAFRQVSAATAALGMAANLTLRYVIFGGEALELASLRSWVARYGDTQPQLVNMYGITETTVHVTYRPLARAEIDSTTRSVIGRPIPDLQLYLLDEQGQPVPAGAVGELCVGGAGLARGYLNRPDLTAARFVPDPFSGVPGARLYRSGDLARQLPDGDLEYLGRSDQQVQLRGFRVELGEISALLHQHPAVREAVVLARSDNPAEPRLVAYIVPQNGHAAPDTLQPAQLPAVLRGFLSTRLPDYMLPAAIVPLAALPLTSNGKLDRAALPAPDSSRPLLDQPFVPPRTPAEVALAAIWAQVLELDQVGIHDNFFALGGDSIRSVQVFARAREQGIHFTLPQLLQHPTIAALSAQLATAPDSVSQTLAPFALISAEERGRLPGDIADAYPLTALQSGMLFHSVTGAAQGVYHDVFSFHLRLPLDLAQLRAAIDELAQVHPILRTAFDLSSFSEPLQLVYRSATVPLACDDISALPAAEAEALLARLLTTENQRSFDWTQPPLLRFHIHRRSADTFQLTMSVHHAILDGWSVASLFTELLQRYVRRVLDPTLPLLLAPSAQFRDFVALERQAEQDVEQARFWQTLLAGWVPLALPPRSAPAQPDELAERSYTVALPPDLAAGLSRLAQQEALPLKSVLLAAHLRVLALLGGTSDVATGLVTHGRPDVAEGERILGLFLNTLPLRLELRGGSWRDLLHATFAAEQAQWPARRYPLAAIQRAHPALAQMSTAFNFTHFHVYQQVSAIPGVEVLDAQIVERTNFSLVAQFSLAPGGQMVQLRLDYDPTALSAAQVAQIGGYYTRVLAAIHTDLEQNYLYFSPLSAAERQQLLHGWNRPLPSVAAPAATLHDWFAQQAARTPDAIALSWNGQQICYAALERRANQLAHVLHRHGVGPEQRVGLLLERGPTLLIALLAVLKAGAAYVPLDPAYPSARRDFILRDAQVRLLLSDDIIPPAAEEAAPPYQQIALRDWTPFAQEATYPPCSGATVANLAYLIYTSGSTGTPKGVMVSHAQVVRLFTATAPWFAFNARDVWTLFHSTAFDFSVWEIWGAWLFGGRLVVVPYLLSRSPEQFAQLLRAEAVTVLNQTPTAFRQLIPADAALGSSASLSLRYVIFGGEALELASLRPWVARYGDAQPQLVNMYGITETTVHVTYRPLARAEIEGTTRSVIGEPIPDLPLYLLDGQGQPVPIGVVGELCVGGAGLARGYLHRPDLTATRFVPDPFSGVAGARLYRSGDLARRLPDGDLEYLGRGDQQVQLRGFRVELGEITAQLLQYPAVREAVVLARADRPSELRLVAYIVPQDEQTTPDAPAPEQLPAALRSFLSTRLPDYMLPSAIVPLAALPLTSNGKLDRAALPAPDSNRPTLDQPFVPPRNPAEAALAAIWSQVLGVDRVGIHDNFFALGGDSIRSVQVLARAREQGISLSLPDLLQRPSIAALSDTLRLDQALSAPSSLAPFALLNPADRVRLPANVEDAYPLTALQSGMFFHSVASAAEGVYHDIFSFHLRLPLDLAQLRTAVGELAEAHPILRSAFDLTSFSEPLQLVYHSVTVPFGVDDLSALPHDASEAAVAAWMAEEKHHAFVWTQPPLLRVYVHLRSAETFQLSVSFHHAILDGWSVASLLTELLQRYVRRVLNPELALLPAPSYGFRDFVALERQALQDTEQANFWRELLHDSTLTQLPLNAAPADTTAPEHSGINVVLPPGVSTGLQRLAQQEALPLKSVLLAAHLRVLALLGGTSDVVTGLVTHGRPDVAEGERILGLFLNTLPLRLELHGGSWRDLLHATFAAEQAQWPARRYPLAAIQQMLGRGTLFETAFNFIHFHVYQHITAIPGVEVLGEQIFERTNFSLVAQFGLDLGGQMIGLRLDYDPQRLSAAQVAQIGDYYTRVLAAMSADPEQNYLHFSPLSAAERQQLLHGWNRPLPSVAAPAATLHDWFAQQAARTPDAIALSWNGQQICYAALERRANQLAHALHRRGVGPEQRVGLLLERGPTLLIALLAVLKAGAAYVPLDPAYPSARRDFILRDAQVRLLLSDDPHPPVTADSAPSYQQLALHDWTPFAQEATHPPCSGATAANLAYLIYTSGSTGMPKGVMVSHAQVLRLFTATAPWFAFNARDVWTLFHSTAFDFSVWEIWGAWLFGGRLVVVPYLLSRSPEQFAQLLRAEAVTVLNQTPTAFRQLIPADAALGSSASLSLRYVIFGGEALELASLRPWVARYGDAQPQLVNMYGITETTVHVTYRPLARAEIEGTTRSVIGEPIPDLPLYLLDGQGQPVPIGVVGELCVGGAGLARGYLHRPDLTATRFVPDPFSGVAGARLYRSGDLARRLPNGDLEYLGRSDQQVQLRGFRVELGEITAQLLQYPAVREAVVVPRNDRGTETRLVAYLTPQTDIDAIHLADLRNFLSTRLPDYMIPATFVRLDALPLTSNGKLDRAALPAPSSRPTLDQPFIPPRNPAEATLAAIWAQVLGVDRVGIHDNFFALGGDSIRSVQVLAHAREQGLSLSLPDLFQRPTIAALSDTLQQEQALLSVAQSAEAFSLLTPQDRSRLPTTVEDAYPLTVLQSGMLFHNLVNPEQGIYHDLFSFHVRFPLDVAQLQVALDQLAALHPLLRTAFDLRHFHEPLQLVYAHGSIPLAVTDLRDLSLAAADAAIAAWAAEERLRSFDWTQPPLLRFHIHRRSAEAFQLTMSFHHAILDGWSAASLLAELLQRYVRLIRDPDLPLLPPPTLHFRDYILMERQALASEEMRAFWQAKLHDRTLTPLPRWPQPPAVPGEVPPTARTVRIPLAVSDGLYRVARQANVPLKSVLLAAHLRVLALLSAHDDVITGLVMHGRPETSTSERMIGLFLNTLPLRVDLRDGTWLDLVQRAFDAERELLPLRSYPLAQIQRLMGNEPLFEAIFNFTNFHVYDQVNATSGVELLDEIIVTRTNFALTANFGVNINTNAVTLRLDYEPQQLPAAQMQQIGDYYLRALTALATQPNASLHTAPLLSSAERQQLLVEWNSTRPINAAHTLPDLIEAQVVATPAALAVAAADGSLSYAALNQQANRLAHYLRDLGVAAETPVIVCLERSAQLFVAVLAIWKANAAYVPLDPTQPPQRLQAILAATGAPVVLTQTQLQAAFAPTAAQVLCLDAPPPALAEASAHNPPRDTRPAQLAYIIFTSGSTGTPKGVMINHAALHNLAQALAANITLPHAGPLRISFNAPLFFDSSLKQLVQLARGHTLVIVPEAMRQDASALLAFIRQQRLDWFDCTPTQLRMLMLAGLAEQPALLPALLLIGGEALDSATWQFLAAQPTTRAYNVYGPTECTVDASLSLISAESPVPVIGRALPNVPLYVLDQRLQPVPVGVPGELFIGGVQVARGYLHRPDLTAERFVPDPFSTTPGARLYRSGDQVRYLPDGTLEFLGRIDQQVKVRGYRIELGEIRATLMQHPAVGTAAVLLHPGTTGDQQIVAYVVPGATEGEQASATTLQDTLQRFLRERLPAYMLPAQLRQLEALPLTPNGKLDLRALPNPSAPPDAADRSLIAPRDSVETQIAQIWAEVLGLARVDVERSFRDLGGHSLNALLLSIRLNERFGKNFPIASLLHDATVASQAAMLRGAALQLAAPSALVDIKPSGSRRPFFAVHPVSGVAFCYNELAYRLHPDQPFYGLQFSGFTPAERATLSIPQIAARYITAIRSVQPSGPYQLGGWSLGGVIAFEMARQLHAQGEVVELLALMDSSRTDLSAEASDGATVTDIVAIAQFLGVDGVAQAPLPLDISEGDPAQQLDALLQHALDQQLLPAHLTLEQARDLYTLLWENIGTLRAARSRYNAAYYPGNLVCFQASDNPATSGIDLAAEWQGVVGGSVAQHSIPGDHYAILRPPHVASVAAQLQAYLDGVAP